MSSTAVLEYNVTDIQAPSVAGPEAASSWLRVCATEDLEPGWGEAALIQGQQVALFRMADGSVFAVSHTDPATGAQVMARGIVGSRGERLTIASPLHKDVYDLQSGECLSNPALRLTAYPTRLTEGSIEIQLAA
ncbi:nitrite reductase small subunit NirD [Pseudarthrobacter sp. J1763]|uniref:nitrite reductase small subunit NirD n=1 Tax=Pseudarthrobacter sp. J1763 TaxID=3420445 RepID=UPI003D2D1AFC